MADSTENSPDTVSESERSNLINRIDELEHLLAEKKKESERAKLPRLKVGSDGIPVLIEPFTADKVNPARDKEFQQIKENDQLINDIINKVDEEISKDLDELILMLKDSIIDEVKTRLLEELQNKKDK